MPELRKHRDLKLGLGAGTTTLGNFAERVNWVKKTSVTNAFSSRAGETREGQTFGSWRGLQGQDKRKATQAARGVVVYAGTTSTAFGKQELTRRFAVVAQDSQFACQSRDDWDNRNYKTSRPWPGRAQAEAGAWLHTSVKYTA